MCWVCLVLCRSWHRLFCLFFFYFCLFYFYHFFVNQEKEILEENFFRTRGTLPFSFQLPLPSFSGDLYSHLLLLLTVLQMSPIHSHLNVQIFRSTSRILFPLSHPPQKKEIKNFKKRRKKNTVLIYSLF